jgi:hypothetical protein
MNVRYIKTFDTTQPIVRELKKYVRSHVSPVEIVGAEVDPLNLDPRNIRLIKTPQILKFELQIIEEGEPGYSPLRREGAKTSKGALRSAERALSPEDYRTRRARSIAMAFPVSRERVRRAGLLERVRQLPGFASVTETQVVQAAINLLLSAEIVAGDRHYTKLRTDLQKTIWEHVTSRSEIADGDDSASVLDPGLIARQVELDVRHVLKQARVSVAGRSFSSLQTLFMRQGYVSD